MTPARESSKCFRQSSDQQCSDPGHSAARDNLSGCLLTCKLGTTDQFAPPCTVLHKQYQIRLLTDTPTDHDSDSGPDFMLVEKDFGVRMVGF